MSEGKGSHPDGGSCESTLVARKAVTREMMLAGDRDGVVVVVVAAKVLDADADEDEDEDVATTVDWRSGVEGAVEPAPRYGCGEARCAAAAEDETAPERDAEAVSVSR